jgi:DNA-binding transcriptional ArsR family regulator
MQAISDETGLDETFAALANGTRRAILGHLAHGPATVNELAEPFALSLPAISKHLKVLERAGLVQRSRHAQFRPCELDPAPLRAASAWAQRQQSIWEARFDRMEQHLADLQSEPRPSTKRKRTQEEANRR